MKIICLLSSCLLLVLLQGCASTSSNGVQYRNQAAFNPSLAQGNNYIYRSPPPIVGVHLGR